MRTEIAESIASLEQNLSNADLSETEAASVSIRLALARCFLYGNNLVAAALECLAAGKKLYHPNDTRGHALVKRLNPDGFSG